MAHLGRHVATRAHKALEADVLAVDALVKRWSIKRAQLLGHGQQQRLAKVANAQVDVAAAAVKQQHILRLEVAMEHALG